MWGPIENQKMELIHNWTLVAVCVMRNFAHEKEKKSLQETVEHKRATEQDRISLR